VNKNKHGSNFNENKAGDVVSGKGADADLDWDSDDEKAVEDNVASVSDLVGEHKTDEAEKREVRK